MLSSYILLSALCSLATSLNSFPGNSVSVDNRTLSEIYAAAQKEVGTLQIAWGGDAHSQIAQLVPFFEESFPKIKFNWTINLSKYHVANINRAHQQSQLYADVVALQTLGDFDLWKENGQLVPYKPPTYDLVYAELKDPDSTWLPFKFLSFGTFIYNQTKTGNAAIPTSYTDLLNPEWKSKLVLTYPNDDDAINFTFTQIIRKYGWEWFEALLNQDVQWVRGTQTPAIILGENGPRSLSFTTFQTPGLNESAPVSDQYMTWAQSSAIFAGTSMPESSKLFIAFLFSLSFQTASSGRFSTFETLPTPIWNVSNTDGSSFHRYMLQKPLVESWRGQYESYLGTPQGANPLTLY